ARTDAAQRFMVGYARAPRVNTAGFGKGQGRVEVAKFLARPTTEKKGGLNDRITPAGLDPDARRTVQAAGDDRALFERLGCVTGEMADASRVIDQSFVDYAVSVLGPYPR